MSSGCLVCRCHDVFIWCYVCFVLLRFRLCGLLEAAALRSIVFRYAGTPTATRVSFFFSFFILGDVTFSDIFFAVFSLYREYVVRSFFPDGVFLPCDHGMDF